MSLSSSARIRVALEPGSLAWVRTQGRGRQRAVETGAIPCVSDGSAEPWRSAAEALAQLAADWRKTAAEVTVVLSNHFVRYELIPWTEKLGRDEEEQAFVRYRYSKVYGERSKRWDTRLSPAPAGAARLASAVDASLLEAIRAAFPASGEAKLVSVQPYLMAAYNRWRPLVGASAWLLLVEAGRACLARFENDVWTAVRNARGDFGGPAQWVEIADRERHRVGIEATPEVAHVHGRLNGAFPSSEVQGWTFRKLTVEPLAGLDPERIESVAVALCAP